ncbi:NUDIX domain-containing protein [Hyphobacterium sp. HN65]|uniref:NUDIX domain-containing protein n=1 Tax=Hyphobacterium lacteum TaxID=3116575 RepID=A0ABU7LNG7_9PROT|nr:NUDIX domain-containing protein [Hyphobacterium sp. HN65]MEE2525129.1 NUDIX domain-containing protein [Hyphobacterium sp. HN65]
MSGQKPRALRPKLAGTLILTRRTRRGREILMGKRSSKHAFMPEQYVFPGGRVDRADHYAPLAGMMTGDDAKCMTRILGERRAWAAAAAAIRETAEEAGYLVGQPGKLEARHANWRPFRRGEVRPDASSLQLIARAITPPGRVRRFDAWFFHADADEAIAGEVRLKSEELLDIRWVTAKEAEGLPLPHITRFVLGELERRLSDPDIRPRHFRELARRMRVDPL